MQFLQECTLLKIEDILPCFPDFVTIEHFKVQGSEGGGDGGAEGEIQYPPVIKYLVLS